jgi:hypothetical protein
MRTDKRKDALQYGTRQRRDDLTLSGRGRGIDRLVSPREVLPVGRRLLLLLPLLEPPHDLKSRQLAFEAALLRARRSGRGKGKGEGSLGAY